MSENSHQTLERNLMVVVTILLCFGFFILHNNRKKQFAKVGVGYEDKSALYLNKDMNTRELSDLLVNGNYIFDVQDALFIANHIKTKLDNGSILPNLGELNKRTFRIPIAHADSLGGAGFKLRIEQSLSTLGFSDEVIEKYAFPPGDTLDLHSGEESIQVMVQKTDMTLNGIKKQLKKIAGKDKVNIAGVLVRLKEHSYLTDTVLAGTKTKVHYEAIDTVLGYALTNEEGLVIFKGLKKDGYYSVLPVKHGFEYGSSKGTSRGALGRLKANDRKFAFLQREHQITPFDTQTYRRLKEDNVLTVRTPSQYKSSLVIGLIFFIIAWWALYFFLRDRSRLLPVLMILTGIGLLMMYAVANPLTDRLLGCDMAVGSIVGVILLGIISQIDFSKFFNSQYQWFGWLKRRKKNQKTPFVGIQFDFVMQFLNWVSMPFEKKIQPNSVVTLEGLAVYRLKLVVKSIIALLFFPFELILRFVSWITSPLFKPLLAIQGVGYLILAFALLALLYVFGSGPEGSGVKVNLFFFQPSEIIKYLILLFLAAFFKNNAEKIQKFSEVFDWKHIKAQTKTVAATIFGLIALLACYFMMGDMGPAMVLAIAFVFIYSVVRRDLWQLLIGTLSFIIILYLGSLYDSSPLTLAGFAILWLFLWLCYGLVKAKKQLYESSIFMNILISAFLFGAPLMNAVGLSHQAQRLQDRTDICLSGVWNNEVRGGDHIAQGLWSASTGGLTGQTLGNGNPNLVPAFHTDMIFTSIGEEMGWIGLLVIICCIAILIHRSLHIGYKSGNSFLFFLGTGIAIVTGVQFLVITLGSLGLIPLTGVAVPFLSFGKTSLIINLAAFGILLSVSKKQATELQAQDFEEKRYHRMVGLGSFSYCSISVVLLGFLLWIQFFARDSYLIRPAYVTNQQGERVIEYNPRIQLLIKHLDAGNVYDCNGILLATNNKEFIQQQIDEGKFADVDKMIYSKEMKLHKQRYYPFGDNLFFWLGDYNTKILWNIRDNDPRGYMAESRHLAALRGFDNLKYDESGNIIKGALIAKKHKGSTFLNPVEKESAYTEYDYSAILPLLKEGINGRKVEAWNKKREERDITLTVDAVLQTQMQSEIQSYAAQNFKGFVWNKLRISVVVLNAENGNLLCSANYPLPNRDSLRYKFDYKDNNLNEKAYTDRDLGLTYQTAPGSTAKVMSALAGLQKLGVSAVNKTYYIDEKEVVEVGIEPRNHRVSMEEAIVKSSNNYFINLVNDQNLYPQLDSIYSSVGVRIDKEFYKGGVLRSKALTPYYLNYAISEKEYRTEVANTANRGIHRYNSYMAKRNKDSRHPYYEKMNWNETAWAWGQGTLRATPLNMARIASIVANDGVFTPTQFVFKGNNSLKIPDYETITMVSDSSARELKGFMVKESDKHRDKGYTFPRGLEMGGKTGTPERDLHYKIISKDGRATSAVRRTNDGWYIFFINSAKEDAPLAVAVRMERLGTGISGNAVRLTDKVIIKTLKALGYI